MTDPKVEFLIPFGEARFIADHREDMSEFLAAVEAARGELAVLRAQRDAALAACDNALLAPMRYAQTHDLADAVRAALGVQPEPGEQT